MRNLARIRSGKTRAPTSTVNRGGRGPSSAPGLAPLPPASDSSSRSTPMAPFSAGARRSQHRPLNVRRTPLAHGVWRYLGKGRFGVTIWDNLFHDINTGQQLWYNKLRLELTLVDDRDQRHRERDSGNHRSARGCGGVAHRQPPTSCASRSSRSSRAAILTGSVAASAWNLPVLATGLVPILRHGSHFGTEGLGMLANAERASRVDFLALPHRREARRRRNGRGLQSRRFAASPPRGAQVRLRRSGP